MADIITNPEIPYGGNVPAGLFPSKTIFIQGYVPPQSEKFHINLQCGLQSQPRSDIALHFNPRFIFKQQNAEYVVLNSLVSQKWGGEERGGTFPFVRGQNFEVIILCDVNEYKVAVNGVHFVSFKHRIPDLQRVTCVHIDGGVKIYNIRYDPPSVAIPAAAVYPPAALMQNEMTVMNPPTPYVGALSGSLQNGTMIKVKLTVNPNPTRFDINLQSSTQENPRPNIAFHFNPRFNDATIRRNSLKGGRWETEEKAAPFFPFVAAGTFEISILCMKKCYIVLVDGNKMFEYNHRQDVHTVNALTVHGDVIIREISMVQ